MSTTIEFGFDLPTVLSTSNAAGVSYSSNGSLSHQESTNSALTSPPYSSKSSSVENMKINKQSSSSSHPRHHSDRKLKKKRPPGYYSQEYQQMLEPSTDKHLNSNDINEQTPQHEQNTTDERLHMCNQWVDSTIHHQHDDDKQSTNDEDELESDSQETTTDTDNDNEHPQNISINKTTLNNNNNESSVYSTSVASGASIETLKPSSDSLSSAAKSKPSSWAALFRDTQPATNLPTQSVPTSQLNVTSKVPTTTSPQQNGRTNSTSSFHPKSNYNVYNSNGEDSRSLEGSIERSLNCFISLSLLQIDYFSKCEVRPSAMALKPRGLLNKSNYCYVNAVSTSRQFSIH